MKVKLTNMLRQNERKKRKNRYRKLNRGRDLYTLKINYKEKRTGGKTNKK